MKNNLSFNKIFCIGMNKTGTNSLHKAFVELGLKSIHYSFPGKNRAERVENARLIREQFYQCKKEGEMLLKYIDNYDAYSDIYPIRDNFEILDTQYPNSKFIYTDRNTEDWIKSRAKHVERNIENTKNKIYTTSFVEVDKDKWIKIKVNHYQRVLDYFKNKSDKLLIINLCDGEGYEKLCPFLGLKIMHKSFPWKNQAS